MGLEKMGLPPKPYEKGKDWTPDSTNCEGCQVTFTWINRKHHCRRCGGLFCNNCTSSRLYLRGQGDAPGRVCEPCKLIEEAAKFELRTGKSKASRGGTKASNKDDGSDTLLKQLLKPDGKSQDEVNVESILASVADTDSDEHELASPSKENDPADPARLHEQAQEEKKRYGALKKQGKDAEALKAFKRAKELERQAEAREKVMRHQRRVSVGSNSQLVGQHSKLSPSKEDPGSPDTENSSLSRRKSELGENQKKRRASQDQAKEKVSTSEKDDFLQDLKALGWSDKEIREADKRPVAKSEEQLLAELAAEARPKSDRAASSAAPGGAMSAQIMSHKRQALVLKKEGRLAEAKEELRKAKILEKQAEEMALLGQAEGEDEASDDDDLMALIRGLERDEKSKGTVGKGGASQSIPEDFALFPSFVDDDDDAHVEVDDDDLDDPEMVAALRAMGWEEEAAGLERTSKSQSKTPKTTQLTVPNLKEQILARKRKALVFKREGKIPEARAELAEAKKLEQQLKDVPGSVDAPGSADAPLNIGQAPVQVPVPAFDVSDDKIEDSEEKVEVTDEDMRDPEMMAALRAMGFGDESTPSDEVITTVVKDNTVEKAALNREILGLKRQALALKKEGNVNEARETLRRAKVLEHQLQDLQAVSQRQEETPVLIKESRTIRRGAQALPVLSGLPNFDDEGEEEDVEVDNADLVDPDIAAALAAVGWQDDPEDKSADLHVAVTKNDIPSPRAPVVSDAVPENLKSAGELQFEKVEVKKVEIKESVPTSGASAKSAPLQASSNHVLSIKTKSKLQQELLGRKRRALAFKRKGKSEEARIELQEAKIIEQQLAELEKGLAVIPPTVAEPKLAAAVQTDHPPPQQASVQLLKKDPEPSRPIYLDDEPVDEVEVTDDDMQDPALLAALAGMGWQGDKEVAGPSKSTSVLKKSSTIGEKGSVGGSAKPLDKKAQTGKGGEKIGNILEFDWGNPLWHAKKDGKEMGTRGVHTELTVNSSQRNEEENPFEGEYGEIGQSLDLVPPLLDPSGPKDSAAPLQQRNSWFMDLLSGDRFKPNQSKEPTSVIKDSQSKIPSALNEPISVDEEDVGDVMDPKLMAALKGVGITPDGSGKKETAHFEGASQPKNSGSRAVLPPVPQVTSKPPERPPHSASSTKPTVVSVPEATVSVQPATLNLHQEIMAHKRKALALKREGKAAEAREELRKAKLLLSEVVVLTSTVTSAGTSNASAHGKVEEVSASTSVTPSRLEPLNPVKTSPPSKGPARKEEMQKQVRQTKDRMKLQQESLAHKRKAMGLRREGKIDEADAEYELAKNLEKQMEDLDPMHGKEDLGDVAGVDDLLDPQLLAALKGIGFREGDLAGASGPKATVKTSTGVAGQPRSDVGSSSRSSVGGTVTPLKLASGTLEAEKKQIEEQIRAQKLQAVQLKRAGKQGEALEKLRGAKQLEKRLLTLTS